MGSKTTDGEIIRWNFIEPSVYLGGTGEGRRRGGNSFLPFVVIKL